MRTTVRDAFVISPLAWAALALAAATAGCTSTGGLLSGDKIDYKSGATQTQGLEVPPDLTQLAREGRYRAPAAVVSAAAAAAQPGAPAAAPATPAAGAGPQTVAPNVLAGMRIERDGDMRWLSLPVPPEKVWDQVRTFWIDSGFTLAVDDARIGVLATDWAENRAKLPQDFVRRTLGRVLENLYDTGERDRFHTRIERTATGSEVYITHRGLVEVLTDRVVDDEIRWQPRPADKQLEAEFLARLMVRLGGDQAAAEAAVAAAAAPAPARARLLEGEPAALEVDEDFDRAWRRVGLALDRSGFTVEDRNRAEGVYFVRYVDAAQADKGFFARIFSSSNEAGKAERYRIALRGAADKTRVAVLTAEGQPVAGDAGARIAKLLVAELK